MRLGNNDKVSLVRLNDWRIQIFNEWEDYWLGNIPKDFHLKATSARKYLIALLKDFFSTLNIEAFKIEVSIEGYYACSSEEYIIKSGSKIYLLSFQVHD